MCDKIQFFFQMSTSGWRTGIEQDMKECLFVRLFAIVGELMCSAHTLDNNMIIINK